MLTSKGNLSWRLRNIRGITNTRHFIQILGDRKFYFVICISDLYGLWQEYGTAQSPTEREIKPDKGEYSHIAATLLRRIARERHNVAALTATVTLTLAHVK